MVEKNGKPSLAELKAWAHDSTTIWIIRQLRQRFPDYRELLPARSQEAIYLLNYRVGSNAVLETLAKIIENGDI